MMFRKWKEKKEMIANYPKLERNLSYVNECLAQERSDNEANIQQYVHLSSSYRDIESDCYEKQVEILRLNDENHKLRQGIIHLNNEKNKEIDDRTHTIKIQEDEIIYYKRIYETFQGKRENEKNYDLLNVEHKLLEFKYDLLSKGYEFVEFDSSSMSYYLDIKEHELMGYIEVKCGYLGDKHRSILAKLKNKTPC